MELILAADLMGGMVVHGEKGDRTTYRPLTWGLAPSAEPADYIDALCPRYLYIADLDRIAGTGDHTGVIAGCAARVEVCYVDRGCRSRADFLAIDHVVNVVGTETGASSPAGLSAYQGGYLSIDVKDGQVIPWGLPPVAVLKNAAEMSFDGCIILNIGAVGTGGGMPADRLEDLRSAYDGRLLYGGGVGGTEDLGHLSDAGFDGAIIATALHRGAIPLQWIRRGEVC